MLTPAQLSLFAAQRISRREKIPPHALLVANCGDHYDIFNNKGVFFGTARGENELLVTLSHAISRPEDFDVPGPSDLAIDARGYAVRSILHAPRINHPEPAFVICEAPSEDLGF